jgi:hypothetical protein
VDENDDVTQAPVDANSQGYEVWKVENTCDTCQKVITQCEGH